MTRRRRGTRRRCPCSPSARPSVARTSPRGRRARSRRRCPRPRSPARVSCPPRRRDRLRRRPPTGARRGDRERAPKPLAKIAEGRRGARDALGPSAPRGEWRGRERHREWCRRRGWRSSSSRIPRERVVEWPGGRKRSPPLGRAIFSLSQQIFSFATCQETTLRQDGTRRRAAHRPAWLDERLFRHARGFSPRAHARTRRLRVL